MDKLSANQIKDLREKAKGSLYFFAKGVLGFDWLTPHIHLPLCHLLEDFQANKRLAICLPRGWLKTTLCSISYPLWRAINDPDISVLLVQNTYANAVKKNLVIKSIVESNQLFRALFPELLPKRDAVWRGDSLYLNRRATHDVGTFEAAGAGTQVTSRHYDVIIEDDTVAPELSDLGEFNLVPTKEQVTQAIGWHRLAHPLLKDQARDQIMVVGTRWFEKDLISWVKANEPSYKFYFRACREDAKGNPDLKGKITYPERFGPEVLDELRASLGPYMFHCLYLNQPIRSGDMTFRPEWFKWYDHEPSGLMVWTTVDPAGDPSTAKGDPDYNVVMTCGKDLQTGLIYVLDYSRERCNPGQLISLIFDHVRRWGPVMVGIEAVAYQATLSYWLRERMRAEDNWFRVEELRPGRQSKDSRVRGLQPLFSNGVIHLRRHMRELESELLAFPLGAHDDLVDALSMQLGLWRVTRALEEDRLNGLSDDPLSVDSLIEELSSRGKPKSLGVLDMLEAPTYN